METPLTSETSRRLEAGQAILERHGMDVDLKDALSRFAIGLLQGRERRMSLVSLRASQAGTGDRTRRKSKRVWRMSK